MLDNVRIVMVNTSHSGNIGAAARAMKTMGLTNLYLVDPADYPSGRASAMASGASDVLESATIVGTLEEAVADCHLVVGTSARLRTIPMPHMDVRPCAEAIAPQALDGQNVAIVFGRENSGLTNEELRMCHWHIGIDADDEYGVLNVAAAVQVICYELRQAWRMSADEARRIGSPQIPVEMVRWDRPLAKQQEVEGFFEHFEKTLIDLDWYDPENPRALLTRYRRLFMRARMDQHEISMMRGMLNAVQQAVKKITE